MKFSSSPGVGSSCWCLIRKTGGSGLSEFGKFALESWKKLSSGFFIIWMIATQHMQGVLSATTLSIVPLIRPFQWQCLMLPVSYATIFLNFYSNHIKLLNVR